MERITLNLNEKAVRNVERMPIGINLNFLMDGGYYPDAKRPLDSALREMGAGYLRYPGGEKSDNTLWALPPYEKPEPTLARYGEFELRECFAEFVEADYRHFKSFVLDFDAFIALCRKVGAEPIVVVPYDTMFIPPMPGCVIPTREELLRNAVEWVLYANVRMGYGVKYWEIGNESYIVAHRSGARACDYAADLVAFSAAMKEIDPDILIVANGPNCVHENEKSVATLDRDAGTDWWKEVFRYGSTHIDRIAFHNYPCLGWGGYGHYAQEDTCLTEAPEKVQQILNQYCTEGESGRIKLMLTETNSADWSEWVPGAEKAPWTFSATLGHALVLADILGSHLMMDSVESIIVWNTRWVLNNKKPVHEFWDALDPDNNLLPSGMVMHLWGKYLLSEMMPVHTCKGISAYASVSRDRSRVHLFLINKCEAERKVSLSVCGDASVYDLAEGAVFTGNGESDFAPVCESYQLLEFGWDTEVELPPVSFVVLCFKARTLSKDS